VPNAIHSVSAQHFTWRNYPPNHQLISVKAQLLSLSMIIFVQTERSCKYSARCCLYSICTVSVSTVSVCTVSVQCLYSVLQCLYSVCLYSICLYSVCLYSVRLYSVCTVSLQCLSVCLYSVCLSVCLSVCNTLQLISVKPTDANQFAAHFYSKAQLHFQKQKFWQLFFCLKQIINCWGNESWCQLTATWFVGETIKYLTYVMQ
jgi:hypothetical protein